MQIESLQQLTDILLTKKMELQGVVEQLNEHHHDNASNEVCTAVMKNYLILH